MYHKPQLDFPLLPNFCITYSNANSPKYKKYPVTGLRLCLVMCTSVQMQAAAGCEKQQSWEVFLQAAH